MTNTNVFLSTSKLLLFFAMCFSTNAQGATTKNELTGSNFTNTLNSELIKNVNIRLYAQNENLLIRFENGNSVLFKPNNDQFGHRLLKNKTHTHEKLGRIETHNKKRIWHSNQNVNVEFLGSYPVAVSIDEQYVALNYKQKELVHANFTNENHSHLSENQTRAFEQLQAALERVEQSACATEDTEDQCTDPDAPLPVGFGTTHDANELHINTRPADCHSFFTAYPSIERGTAIEAALANQPPYIGSESGSHSFPIADYWNNGNVYVVISRDLTASAYQPILNPDGFYEQLITDGENIQENLIQPLANDGQISQTSLGETTTLYNEEAQVIYLDVVVQFGVMSEAQKNQFERAAEELLGLYGIILRLVMIP